MQIIIGNRYWLWLISLSSVAILQGIAISQEHLGAPRSRPALMLTESFEFLADSEGSRASLFTLSMAGTADVKKMDYRPEDYLPELSEEFSWDAHPDESVEEELNHLIQNSQEEHQETTLGDSASESELENSTRPVIVHTVKPGETLSRIARLYDMTVSTLVLYNGLTNPNAIRPGFQLHLAFEQEFEHVVQKGDSLWSIANQYNVKLEDLQRLNPTAPTNLVIGSKIQVVVEDLSELNVQRILAARGKGPRFVWPVKGRVSSEVGWRIHPITREKRRHNGLDIAAPTGTPIYAGSDAKVVFAGALRGYGNIVILDHGGGLTTRYAHCSKLHVKRGGRVIRGQKIAEVGSTGLSTAPHLHFEVRKMGKPLNPRDYL